MHLDGTCPSIICKYCTPDTTHRLGQVLMPKIVHQFLVSSLWTQPKTKAWCVIVYKEVSWETTNQLINMWWQTESWEMMKGWAYLLYLRVLHSHLHYVGHKCRTLGKQSGIKCETPLRTSNENIGQNSIWCRFKEQLWETHREPIEPI
jgi:hypothetical protein